MGLLTPEQLANDLGRLPPDVGAHLLGERQAGATGPRGRQQGGRGEERARVEQRGAAAGAGPGDGRRERWAGGGRAFTASPT